MPLLTHCAAALPGWGHAHLGLLIYLLPSLGLGLLFMALARRYPFFILLLLAGTICHELMHWIVGLVSGGRPASLSIIPRRTGSGWQLGLVRLTNVRWFNAAPAALAPLALLALPYAVARWRTHSGSTFQAIDLALACVLAPQWLACWPSRADWKLAWRSWPAALLLALAAWLAWRYMPTLFPDVTARLCAAPAG